MANPMIGSERAEISIVRDKIGKELLKVKEDRGETYLCVTVASLRDTIIKLKEDPELDYGYFSECLGVDYSTWQHERDLMGRFEVVYNLMSLKHFSRIFVKVAVDDGQSIPTLKDIFMGAEYPEREIQDLFGVQFEGNGPIAGLRFMLPDDWVGYPLRKEYPLGGEDVVFDKGTLGPAVEDISMPHAGESFEGNTGSENVSGR